MEQVFISKLNTPCVNGVRLGRTVHHSLDLWALWNLATRQGDILIIGHFDSWRSTEEQPELCLFRPIKTWVPSEYDLWECPQGCYTGRQNVPPGSIKEAPACPRCGEPRSITFKLREKKAVA